MDQRGRRGGFRAVGFIESSHRCGITAFPSVFAGLERCITNPMSLSQKGRRWTLGLVLSVCPCLSTPAPQATIICNIQPTYLATPTA